MKVFAENRKARNSYEFQEFYESGIVLTGPETKSVRTGAVSIVDAFAIIENEEAFLMEMNIEPYKYADQIDYNPKNQRKLLLHKGEIKKLIGLTSQKGFTLIATKGTADYLLNLDISVEEVLKVHEGRPNIEDLIRSGLVQLIINTPIGSQALHDDAYLRRAALEYNIPTFTTIPGAKAAIKAIKSLQSNKIDTYSLQEIHNF